MMWSIVLLAGWMMIGRTLLRLVNRDLPLIIELASGFLIGNLITVYVLFIGGWWVSYSVLTYVLLGFAITGSVVFFPKQLRLEKAWLGLLAIFSALFSALYLLVWQETSAGIYLRIRGVWGDWGHHIGLPVYFQALNHSSWESPFTAGINFTYSFLHALVPSAMLELGASLYSSLVLTGIIWSVAICLLMIYLVQSLGLKKASLLAPVLFFLSGHLGFLQFFEDLSKREVPLLEFLQHLPLEYGHIWEEGFHLGNFLDFFFVSQRGYVFGFGFGLLFILVLVFSHTKLSKVAAGIILGLLPLVHMHTFMAMLVVSGVWSLLNIKHWRLLVWLWAPTVLLAIPYFSWLFRANMALSSGSFVTWKWGWLVESENWFWFWIKNAPILLTGLIGLKFMPKNYRWLPFAGWLLFILVNVIQFQPNLGDNNKLLVWWYLLAGIVPSLFLIQRLNKVMITILFVSIMTLSGVLQLVWITQNTWEFAAPKDLELARFVSQSCITSRWLTSDRHKHPVFTFAGRPVVMGYRGWLWTWGVDYTGLEQDVKTMFTYPDLAGELYVRYNVGFAVIGETEIYDYQPDIDLWKRTFEIVYDTPDYLVFRIQPCSSTK